MATDKQLSMAASAIALRGVRLFLSAGRNAMERRAQPAAEPAKHRPKPKPVVPGARPPQKVFDMLARTSKFNKHELEALYAMYRRLVTAAQGILPPTAIGQPPAKVDGIDQGTFRDVMHNTFDMITEEAILERIWITWDRGASGGEGALKFEAWVRGLSVLLRGTEEERRNHCFAVYDLNADGYITRDEMFVLLKNSLLKQPGDEDPDEGVRDLVELVLRKMDVDKDGRVSPEDYKDAVEQEPLLLEAFGQCLPSRRHALAFLKTLNPKPKDLRS
ncbi:EF-hand calcium-binding domain-containing protein 1-like [Ostrinia furnacalis]|uniref:EF-hand calcium-binding domain-containing protein 1-like n=1 Tax=Ostrinia furnacalis TaxID=93504 RepID=UPI00103C092F|nr:EF-hand calcium-binding domain-containing protein 1-like [Ostrinia furnacalis]